MGYKIEEVGLEVLGITEKITISKDTTTIVNGGGTVDDITTRIEQIKNQIETSNSDYDKEKLQERLDRN